ncbi:MAG: ferrochelatase [Bacteroidales bacterium]
MSIQKTAVVLINVGTPDSYKVYDVRRYLTQFLNDPRVIDIPWLQRKLLVNLIIVPFRAPKSAKLYRMLWTDKGSPLLYVSQSVVEKLQVNLGERYKVFLGMRYGNPDLRKVLKEIGESGYSRVIIVPLFPQYASSSTGTAIEMVMDQVRRWNIIPEIRFINQFYDHPGFIDSFVKRIKSYDPLKYDHIVFSYHGLPIRHIAKSHPESDCANCRCDLEFPSYGTYCYRATCYETTRLIVEKLGLEKEKWSVGFQSRLSDKWIKPFTDELLIRKAGKGVGKILLVAPAFVTDCLETTIELGMEYKELFIESGGTNLDYVESLNDMPEWIDALDDMITDCKF